jgi:hypothetical protein
MTAKQWIDAYARRLGTEPPTEEEFAMLLDVAGAAAHASERVAAPVACWLCARAGRSPGEALAIALEVSREAAGS